MLLACCLLSSACCAWLLLAWLLCLVACWPMPIASGRMQCAHLCIHMLAYVSVCVRTYLYGVGVQYSTHARGREHRNPTNFVKQSSMIIHLTGKYANPLPNSNRFHSCSWHLFCVFFMGCLRVEGPRNSCSLPRVRTTPNYCPLPRVQTDTPNYLYKHPTSQPTPTTTHMSNRLDKYQT